MLESSFSDAAAKWAPGTGEKTTKYTKNIQQTPGDKLTGAEIGNKIAGKPNSKMTKVVRKEKPMKEPKPVKI